MSNHFTEYADLEGVNWSSLKHLWDGSPLSYRHHLTVPRKDTAALLFGRLVDCLVFEAHTFDARFVVWSGQSRATKAGKEEWAEVLATKGDRDPVDEDDLDKALAMADAVHAHPVAAGLLTGGTAQMTLQWVDPVTGLTCKGRADYITGRTLVDLKTAACIEARRFWASAARYGYHCQMAHYTNGLEAMGSPVDSVYIVAIEKTAPYDVAVYRMTDADLAKGASEVAECLERLKDCIDHDDWPGRYPEEMPSMLPTYLFDSDDITIPEGDTP